MCLNCIDRYCIFMDEANRNLYIDYRYLAKLTATATGLSWS